MYKIIYSNKVITNDIPRLDATIAKRIKNAIETKLLTDPVRFGKPLQYSLSHLRSLRVGDYRVIYQLEISDKHIRIVAISHLRDAYQN